MGGESPYDTSIQIMIAYAQIANRWVSLAGRDDGGLQGGRWVLTFQHCGDEKPILLKEEGPFYDSDVSDWPFPARMDTSTVRPTND